MKYIFVFLTFVISLNSIAQSKKEQIAILTARLDSLNKEYVKDTTYLSNTAETRDREYTIISMQYDEAQEQLKKKSATITDKSNTIKSLNAKNMELMAESKKLYQKIQELETELKALKSASDNPAYLFTLTKVNSDQSLVDIGIYTNGRAIVLDSDVYYDTEMLFERSDSTVTVYVGGNGSYVYNLKNFKSKLLVIKMEFGNPPDLPCKSWLMNTTVSNITSSDILESSGGVYYNENTGEEEFNCSIGDCSYIQNYIDINGY